MGQYIIPDATEAHIDNLVYHVEQKGLLTPDMVWDHGDAAMGQGVLFTDPSRTDADCAALYADWVAPVGEWMRPLPDSVRLHLQHMRDYLAEDPANITNAESVHLIKDLIRAVFYLNRRFETEG